MCCVVVASGGGVIEDGILTPGNTFSAGEFGHIVVSFEGGPQCMCGNSGCVEAYAGGWALSRITEGKKVREKRGGEGASEGKRWIPKYKEQITWKLN